MRELLLFILGWIIAGVLGWLVGTIIDKKFYKGVKAEWKVLFLCMLIGPIVWIVSVKVLIGIWWDRRREKRKIDIAYYGFMPNPYWNEKSLTKLYQERQVFQDKIDGPENDEIITAEDSADLDYWVDMIESLTEEIKGREIVNRTLPKTYK